MDRPPPADTPTSSPYSTPYPTFPIPNITSITPSATPIFPSAPATSSLWHCAPCGRPFLERERHAHLASSAHRKHQRAWNSSDTVQLALEAAEWAIAESRAAGRSGPPSAVWECDLCQRSMQGSSMESHLSGARHARNQGLWDAQEVKTVQEGKRRIEVRKWNPGVPRGNWEVTRGELRRAGLLGIEAVGEGQEEEEWQARLPRGEDQVFVKCEELERNFRKSQEVEQTKEQTKEEARKVQKDSIQTTEIEDAEQTIVEQPEEGRPQNVGEQGTKKDEPAKAKKHRKRILTEEEKQVEENLRKVQEDLIQKIETEDAERTRMEPVQTKEEGEEAVRTRLMENAVVDEQLRLAQERLKRKWVSKLEMVAAAEEQATRYIADQEQPENENGRRQDEEDQEADILSVEEIERFYTPDQQPEADRLPIEEIERFYTPGEEDAVRVLSPVSSIGAMDFMQEAGPSTQTPYEASGFIDPTSEAAILRYLQWQSMVHEMQQLEIWQQQPTVLTFPPMTSIANLPPILYRVYDEASVSTYSCDGFTAGATSMPHDAFNFRNMVNLHSTWSSREKSPFISVTSTPDGAAHQVAIRQARRSQRYIMVALIDTAALFRSHQTRVWKMHDARDHFGLQPWKCHRRAFDHEYICALRIPATAVFACCRPEYFRQNAMMSLRSVGWTGGVEMDWM